uniref:Uncharacterized protein n=1 Tax=Physcomitrium patens TaxID=3218 RepID=A0A2K1JQF0_PHYPA|nr:hypothetical protein PHYPA_016133 [Physcomitrium patens]
MIKMYRKAGSFDQAHINAVMLVPCAYIESYDLCDVYNINEMKLFYSMVLN